MELRSPSLRPLLIPPQGFARHGTREQKYGAAKHQCIRHVIKAIVEAGAFHHCDRHVDNQNHRKHGEA
jgi:hypothetical protein